MLKSVYNWMENRVHSEYAESVLGFLFFLEAIFFLPTDPMLIFYCFEKRERAYRYATIATMASVLGGITAYCIGVFLWQTAGETIIQNSFIKHIITPKTFYYFCNQYKQHEYWAILIAGFTPVPYKAATITAGFCRLSFIPFVICSAISRGARFFLFAFVINKWGKQMKPKIEKYFNILMIATLIILALIFWYFRF